MDKTKIKQTIGQIEASVNKVEPLLSKEEFEDYCDHAYSCISYLRKIESRLVRSVPLTPDEAYAPNTKPSTSN